jgi:hypothetical protein
MEDQGTPVASTSDAAAAPLPSIDADGVAEKLQELMLKDPFRSGFTTDPYWVISFAKLHVTVTAANAGPQSSRRLRRTFDLLAEQVDVSSC